MDKPMSLLPSIPKPLTSLTLTPLDLSHLTSPDLHPHHPHLLPPPNAILLHLLPPPNSILLHLYFQPAHLFHHPITPLFPLPRPPPLQSIVPMIWAQWKSWPCPPMRLPSRCSTSSTARATSCIWVPTQSGERAPSLHRRASPSWMKVSRQIPMARKPKKKLSNIYIFLKVAVRWLFH